MSRASTSRGPAPGPPQQRSRGTSRSAPRCSRPTDAGSPSPARPRPAEPAPSSPSSSPFDRAAPSTRGSSRPLPLVVDPGRGGLEDEQGEEEDDHQHHPTERGGIPHVPLGERLLVNVYVD